ncbi:MAG: HAD family phosphatase [Proteobacteria bacterium]|nr:HAD family phosphatase [Pseudomonadota bacterium]
MSADCRPSLAAAPFAAVIFDMDGTLLDTERLAARAWPVAAAALNIEFDPALVDAMVGRNSRDCTVLIAARHGPAYPVAALQAGMLAAYEHMIDTEGLPLKPGVIALTDALRARAVPLAVATSTRRRRALDKLERAGLVDRFAHVVGGDEITHGKPAPDIYLEAAARLGVPAAACLAIEDSATGYRSAHAAGMTVLLVPDMGDPAAALAPHVPTVLASLDAVAGWVRPYFSEAAESGK